MISLQFFFRHLLRWIFKAKILFFRVLTLLVNHPQPKVQFSRSSWEGDNYGVDEYNEWCALASPNDVVPLNRNEVVLPRQRTFSVL
jgi:hypothetical protein